MNYFINVQIIYKSCIIQSFSSLPLIVTFSVCVSFDFKCLLLYEFSLCQSLSFTFGHVTCFPSPLGHVLTCQPPKFARLNKQKKCSFKISIALLCLCTSLSKVLEFGRIFDSRPKALGLFGN